MLPHDGKRYITFFVNQCNSCCVCQVCSAECVGQIHLWAWLVHHLYIVFLHSQQHALYGSCFGAFLSGFFMIDCNGLWSDSTVTGLPYMYCLDFSTAYTVASISFSICAYLNCLSISECVACKYDWLSIL